MQLPRSPQIRALTSIIALMVAASTGVVLQLSAVRAQQPAALAIVIDGSGSMWGKLAGSNQSKFAATADRLLAHLATIPKTTQVGAVLFGQLSRGGCTASTTLRPLAPYDAADMEAALTRLNPQGRGPLVLGLRQAAEMLRTARGPRHILLIHDDPDNCSQDICAAARDIRQTLTNVHVHAVSLSPKPANRGALACLTQITGGRVIEVNNINQADTAIRLLVRVAALSGGVPIERRPAKRPSARPASNDEKVATLRAPSPEPARAPTPGLMLSAVLKSGGPVIKTGLFWSISRVDGNRATPLHKTARARPSVALEPGRYRVEVRANGYVRTTETDVAKGPRTLLRMNLKAGAVDLSATLDGDAPFVDDATFTVTAASGDAPALWTGLAPRAPLILPAGTYSVAAMAGRAVRRREVTVVSGQRLQLKVPLQAGYITVKPRLAGNRKPNSAVVTIETDDPSSPDGRRTVARSLSPEPNFLLPAGTYYATARIGAAEKREQIAVAAGKVIERTIVVPRMRLQVTSRYRGRKDDITDNVRYRVWRLSSPNTPPLVSSEPEPTFELAPGSYRIESRIGRQNAVIVRDFEVTNAATGRLVLVHEAGSIRLAVEQAPGSKDVYWEIRTPQGDAIWRSLEPSSRVTLKAGRYDIVAEIAGQTSKTPVTIEPGRHLNVELGLN